MSWGTQQKEQAALAPDIIEHDHGNHDLCDPDTCFAAKCRYWRQHGMAVSIPSDWKGPSVRERQKNVISEAIDNGYDPQPVSDKHRWI